jgi:hypothetical protein
VGPSGPALFYYLNVARRRFSQTGFQARLMRHLAGIAAMKLDNY